MFTESYERKLKGNVLTLTESDDIECVNEFEERMITENNIKYFLECHQISFDGKKKFSYDITSKQSLEHLYEEKELKENDLRRIIAGLINVQSVLEEYLLNDENLVLDPKFIYADPETKTPFFIFYPYYNMNIHDSLITLGTFLLERTDHTDENAVRLVYGFYKCVANEDYGFDKLLKNDDIKPWTQQKSEDKGLSANQDDVDKNEELPELIGEIKGHEKYLEEKNGSRFERAALTVSTVTLLILIFYIILARKMNIEEYMPISNKYMMGVIALLGAISVLLPVGVLAGRVRSDEKKRHLHDIEKEIVKAKNKNINQKDVSRKYWGKTENFDEETVHRLVGYKDKEIIEYKISHSPFILGKNAADVDGCLGNPSASRIHAKITIKKGDCFITDLNSTNGTKVNGRMLMANECVKLMENDEISLAGEVFYYR